MVLIETFSSVQYSVWSIVDNIGINGEYLIEVELRRNGLIHGHMGVPT